MSAGAEDAEVFRRLRIVEDDSLTNRHNLGTHEKECALRYGYLCESVEDTNTAMEAIRSDFKKFVLGGGSVALAVIGFLIKLVFFPTT